MTDLELQEELRRRQRAERMAQMKIEKERRERFNRNFKYYVGGLVAIILVIAIVITLLVGMINAISNNKKHKELNEANGQDTAIDVEGSLGGQTGAEGYDGVGAEIYSGVSDGTGVDNYSGLGDGTGLNELGIRGDGTEITASNFDNEGIVNGVANGTTANGTLAGGVGINTQIEGENIKVGDVYFKNDFTASTTSSTKNIYDEEIISEHIVLMNPKTDEIVAMKDAFVQINPASMTKVLTVLVAAEHVDNLDAPVEITLEATDYAYVHDCSSVGYLDGEITTVRDLFYGTILPSGGDAAYALACYVAGSQEAFVDMMNDKLKELGLSQTAHFTNCVGLYDKEHYCTIYDMAIIMKAAVENDWCRDVLSMHVYTTTGTEQHPDGITVSNWFLRRIEDKDCGGEVLCAKTGFVNQSKNCAVSYYIREDGTPLICATAGSSSSWRCIYDHVAIYNNY